MNVQNPWNSKGKEGALVMDDYDSYARQKLGQAVDALDEGDR